jgi:hypothetical protein
MHSTKTRSTNRAPQVPLRDLGFSFRGKADLQICPLLVTLLKPLGLAVRRKAPILVTHSPIGAAITDLTIGHSLRLTRSEPRSNNQTILRTHGSIQP